MSSGPSLCIYASVCASIVDDLYVLRICLWWDWKKASDGTQRILNILNITNVLGVFFFQFSARCHCRPKGVNQRLFINFLYINCNRNLLMILLTFCSLCLPFHIQTLFQRTYNIESKMIITHHVDVDGWHFS